MLHPAKLTSGPFTNQAKMMFAYCALYAVYVGLKQGTNLQAEFKSQVPKEMSLFQFIEKKCNQLLLDKDTKHIAGDILDAASEFRDVVDGSNTNRSKRQKTFTQFCDRTLLF